MEFQRAKQPLSWRANEVVKEIDRKPHLVLRVELKGDHFPHRAAEPFLRVVQDRGEAIDAWFTEESADGRTLVGYFQTELPARGWIEYGYGKDPHGRAPMALETVGVARLDRQRLPQPLQVATAEYVKRKKEAAAGAARPVG